MNTTKQENEFDIVDLHAHILPKADHGSTSVKQSLAQLKYAREVGVTRIFATPHFYPHRHSVDRFICRRNRSCEVLYESGAMTPDMPQIRLGAEVLLFENLDKMPDLHKLCFEGTNQLLVELPFVDLTVEHVETVGKIMDMGIRVVIAHADRYEKKMVDEFVKIGATLQLNVHPLCAFKRQDHLFDWIEKNFVIGIGSDIHGSKRAFYKNFFKAQKKIGPKLAYLCERSDELWNSSREYVFK